MPKRFTPAAFRPTLPAISLGALLVVLCLAGGASRADALGQAVVRTAAALALLAAVLLVDRPARVGGRVVWALLIASVLIVLVQLIPLPPDLWNELPGRVVLRDVTTLSGSPQVWRPLSISPAATINAAGSLVVPVAVLYLTTMLSRGEAARVPGFMLCLIVATMLVGLLQFSGAGFDNVFVNDTPGDVSGTFANRNHFALFLAIGCLVAPAWAMGAEEQSPWRAALGIGLMVLFVLTILATGSRAGILLGLLALLLGLGMVRQGMGRALRRLPRQSVPVAIWAVAVLVVAAIAASVATGRAVSINRLVALDASSDMRTRGFSTVLAMVRTYFPAGTGFGSFDPLFRLHEPFGLLKMTYFNHVHNDFIEVVLDGGLAGAVLLAAAVGWWGWASARAWRGDVGDRLSARLGSAILLLVLIASAFDYPARTPLMMAVIVIAARWLDQRTRGGRGQTLPDAAQHL